jgi:hypothetical protein
LDVSGTNGAAISGALDCSIADVSLTGHGRCCSSQIDACTGGTAGVSTLYEQSDAMHDVNGV